MIPSALLMPDSSSPLAARRSTSDRISSRTQIAPWIAAAMVNTTPIG